MKKFLFLTFFASIPVLYLCAHNASFRLTRQIADMEEEKKLLTEQLEQNKVLLAKVFAYPAIEAKALTIGLTFPNQETLNQINRGQLKAAEPIRNIVAKQNRSQCLR